jgi:hypothetical protein
MVAAGFTLPANAAAVPAGRAGRPGVGLAGSQANIAAASAKADAAHKELDLLVVRKQKELNSSPDLLSATQAVTSALKSLRAAKSAVLEQLTIAPSYAAARKAAADAQAASDLARSSGTPEDQRTILANAAFQADAAVAKLEAEAFARDAAVQSADGGVKEAQAALEQVKAANTKKLQEDREIVKKRAEIQQLEAQVAAWGARANSIEDQQSKKKKKR